MTVVPEHEAVVGKRRPVVAILLGDRALAFGEASNFFWRVTRGVLRVRPYFVEVVRQATILAQGSVIIVLALVLSYGLVTGIESSYAARLVGHPRWPRSARQSGACAS